MVVHYRLLGPLEVEHDGTPVPLPSTGARILLASLLVQADQLVANDVLITNLWGAAPPANARSALQQAVRRLRGILPEDVIRTQPGGYLLELGEHELDARRFEVLLVRLKAERNPHQALALASEALRLWRGEPLANVPSDALRRSVVPVLTEQHFQLVEQHERLRAARPVPRQLPPRTTQFVGRDEELELIGGSAISVLTGTAGVGKTTLAVNWAHDAVARFPDGQLYVNLRGFDPSGTPKTPAEAVLGFIDAFGVPAEQIPPGEAEQVELYQGLLDGKRTLLVLDNAHDGEQVRPLLPRADGCTVVVTSRGPLAGLPNARTLQLGLLSREDAIALLRGRIGGRVDAEPGAVADLVELCARLPLALTIAAVIAAAHPDFSLSVLAEELGDEEERLDALETHDSLTGIRAVFSWSYQRLSGPTARVFRLLGAHRGPDISPAAAASLTASSLDEVREALGELVGAGLVTADGERFGLHDLLRAYAMDLLDDERPEALHRVLDHYTHTALDAEMELNPHRTAIELPAARPGTTPEKIVSSDHALAWFTAEHQVLMGAVREAGRAGLDDHAWQLPWSMVNYLGQRGHWPDAVQVQRIAMEAAQRSGDLGAQARAATMATRACARLGLFEEGHRNLEIALELYRRLDDVEGQARTAAVDGWLYLQENREDEVVRLKKEAVRLYRETGNRMGEAVARNALGHALIRLGEYAEGLDHCEQALLVIREVGNRLFEASALDSIGLAHLGLGHHERAISLFREALALHDHVDMSNVARISENLGTALHAVGDGTGAVAAWRRALRAWEEIGDDAAAEQVRAKLRGS